MGDGQPQTLGPYRLLRRVGRGGFADVWLAERDDGSGGRHEVALKLVDTSIGHRDGMRPDALLREARLVSWLDDPSIVGVEAADIEGNTIWMAMEYCDGGSVTHLLNRMRKRGLPMPPAIAVRIGRDVALALSAAHTATDPDGEPLCVIHRDLKPGNVLLTTRGEIKVCDFGIAKATDETNITGTGMLKGTASYVAPELWHNVRAFSPASDAFALGTLMVEMLTMERLHAGGAMPLVYRRIVEGSGSGDAARVAPFCPPVVPLIEELLARDPAKRASDMAAVASRMEDLLKLMPGPADPGLLLRLLDYDDGTSASPTGLPLRVGQAWQLLVKEILGADLLLVPGPGGEDREWQLARWVPPDEVSVDDIPVTGFGPPELRTSSDSVQAIDTVEGLDDVDAGERTKPFVPDVPKLAANLWTPAGVAPVNVDEPATQLWKGPVGRVEAPRPQEEVASPPEEDFAPPPIRDPEADVREATSYTDLVPASEGRLPPSSLNRTAARPDLSLEPEPKPRRRRRKPFPWALVAAVFVLWGLVVALVVKILT